MLDIKKFYNKCVNIVKIYSNFILSSLYRIAYVFLIIGSIRLKRD